MSVGRSILVLAIAGALLVWWLLHFINAVQAAHPVIQ